VSLMLKPYPEYKESGQDWIGKVPTVWTARSLGSLLAVCNQRNRADLPLLSVVREKGVVIRSSTDENHNFIPDDLSNYKVVRQGDLVINKMKAWQGSLGIAPCDGIVSPAYYVFNCGFHNWRFAQTLLRSKVYVPFFAQASDGVRIGQWDLSIDKMKRIPVFLPSPEEQIAIVDFTGRIDCAIRKLIRAKRRVIELLNEQKQAIIQRAVTRGLDPNVRLKPSGVKWLGEIPKHWNSNPAKYSLLEVDKRSTSGEEELLSVSHLTGVSPRSQKNITMFMAASYVGHKLCEPGDLVVNTMWAWMGALGVSPMKGIVSPSYAVYRPRREGAFVPGFLDCLLRTRPYISEFICRSTGIRSSRLRVYPEQFLKIPLIQPPLSEQAQIVESIQMETESAERSIYRAQQEIDLLREYRSRLITDVVTGKLDVRGIELPELNEVEEVSDVEDEELEDSEELEAVKENVDAD